MFAAEFEDASYSYSESDEERAPNYVVTPTGARVNRLFVTGVLTEVAQAGESILRARVVDPTGAFVVYAGQYQPEAMGFLDGANTPSFVAVTGKARTFQPDDSDLVYTSVRPESVSEVDAPTRDRWTVIAAERTLERIGTFAAALDTGLTGDALTQALEAAGVDRSLAAGIPIAIEQYGTTEAYLAALQEVALDAVRLVADETDEVGDLSHAPDEGGETTFTPVRPVELDASVGAAGVADTATDVTEETGAPDAETPEPAAATDEPDATADPVEEPADDPVEEGVEVGSEPAGEPVADESEATATTETEPSTEVDTDESDSGETDSVEEPVESPGSATDDEPSFEESTANGVSDEPAFEPETDEDEADEESGAYEMDEETRQEVEAEFGTEFSTGNEVDPAGEADIEAPESEGETERTEQEPSPTPDDEPSFEPDDAAASDDTAEPDEPSFEPTDDAEVEEAEATTETDGEAEADADVDLDTVLMEEMKALDDGDGAPRDDLVGRVTDRTGADADAVDDAIQGALMGGQCYEPEDGRLKPI
nr:hypothetical protein [Halomarina rubra]